MRDGALQVKQRSGKFVLRRAGEESDNDLRVAGETIEHSRVERISVDCIEAGVRCARQLQDSLQQVMLLPAHLSVD